MPQKESKSAPKPKKKTALQELARQKKRSRKRLANQNGSQAELVTDAMIVQDQQKVMVSKIASVLPMPDIRRIRSTGFPPKKVLRRKLPIDEASSPPPWMSSESGAEQARRSQSSSSSSSSSISLPSEKMSLTDELYKFAAFVDLTDAERQCREVTIKNIAEVVAFKYPLASLQVFGSYRSNLSTFQSDIDLSIFDRKFVQKDVTNGNFLASEQKLRRQQSEDNITTDNPSQIAVSEVTKTSSVAFSYPVGHRVASDGNSDLIDLTGDDKEELPVSWCLDTTPTPMSIPLASTYNETMNASQDAVSKTVCDEKKRKYSDDDDSEDNNDYEDDEKDNISLSSDDDEGEDQGEGQDKEDSSVGNEDNDLNDFRNLDNNVNVDKVNGSYRKESDVESLEEGEIDDSCTNNFAFNFSGLDAQASDNHNSTALTNLDNAIDYHDSDENIIEVLDDEEDEFDQDSSGMSKSEKQQAARNILFSVDRCLARMDWVESLEFRGKARVPIICMKHASSVSCDISVGESGRDMEDFVERLIHDKRFPVESRGCGSGRRKMSQFFVLSSFLKLFLNLLDLDKPFYGGIGSYKLYVMIANVMNICFEARAKDKTPPDAGFMLIAFFRIYGSPLNLHKYTVINIGTISIDFQPNSIISECQRVFKDAYDVLVYQAWLMESGKMKNTSFLSSLVDRRLLSILRTKAMEKCLSYPILSEASRVEMPMLILKDIQRQVFHTDKWRWVRSVEDLERIDPFLLLRLRSYIHPMDAVNPIVRNGNNRKSNHQHFDFRREKDRKRKIAVNNSRSNSPRSNSSDVQQTKRKKQKVSTDVDNGNRDNSNGEGNGSKKDIGKLGRQGGANAGAKGKKKKKKNVAKKKGGKTERKKATAPVVKKEAPIIKVE